MSATSFSLNVRFRSGDDSIDNYISMLNSPSNLSAANRKRIDGFHVKANDQLWYGDRQVIRQSEYAEVLNHLYDSDTNVRGKGSNLLYKYVFDKYINITRANVVEFLSKQSEYQIGKAPAHRVNKPILSRYPNELWGIDLIECLAYVGSNNRYKYIVTIVDLFSRKTWLCKLTTKNPYKIRDAFVSVIARANVSPNHLLSDQGTEFRTDFDEYLQAEGIVHRRTRAYSPMANGVVERTNQTVRKLLRATMIFNDNKVWHTHLSEIEDNINSSYNSSIKATPNDVWIANKNPIMVRDLPTTVVTPNDKRILARVNLRKKAIKDVAAFQQYEYKEGDIVRVYMPAIFNSLRAMVKADKTKEMIVTYTPDTFEIRHVVVPKQAMLERKRYILQKENGGDVSTQSGKAHQFYASDLTIAENQNETVISMERALLLDGGKANRNDLVYS